MRVRIVTIGSTDVSVVGGSVVGVVRVAGVMKGFGVVDVVCVAGVVGVVRVVGVLGVVRVVRVVGVVVRF